MYTQYPILYMLVILQIYFQSGTFENSNRGVSTEDAEKFASSLLNTPSFTNANPGFSAKLNKLFETYVPQKKEKASDLTFHFTAFLSPLAEEIYTPCNFGISEINQLALKIREGSINYTHIEFLSQQQAEEFDNYSKELLEKVNDFKINIEPLSRINSN